MSSSFLYTLGLHNIALRASPGCQVLTVVFVYAKSPALSSFEDVKFYGSCKYGSCQILLYVAAAAAYQLRTRLRSKFEIF